MSLDARSDEGRWAAVVARDRQADGAFYYSVKTTGVYCRPSCAARLARRENVAFHETCEAAEAAGFRPCKRCHPRGMSQSERNSKLVVRACRLIETADEPPKLAKLASLARMSPFHFHRLFKSTTGLTPKAYADAHRADRVRKALPRASTVTGAIYDAGFNSNGRFYARSKEVLGMTPRAYRTGGARMRISFAVGECYLGSILVAATDTGICAILMGHSADALVRELQDRFDRAEIIGGDEKFEKLVAKVVGFVEHPHLSLDLPLDVHGTAFQLRVWKALCRIRAGKTASYGEIAQRIGRPGAARAVAQACAKNMIAVAIPCHRVVRVDGDPSGYRWGVARKRALLARERAD